MSNVAFDGSDLPRGLVYLETVFACPVYDVIKASESDTRKLKCRVSKILHISSLTRIRLLRLILVVFIRRAIRNPDDTFGAIPLDQKSPSLAENPTIFFLTL